MLCDLFFEQVAIDFWATRHEGRTKASGERRLRLGHAALCACNFGGETRQEVIHRLRRCETRNGGQNTECIAGQHDDVLGVAAKRCLGRVRDVVQRIRAAHVRSQAIVLEIQLFGFWVIDHVLDHCAELRCGFVDFRFGLWAKVDSFGVATALKVERATIRPAMLVIADQRARRISGKRRFACPG